MARPAPHGTCKTCSELKRTNGLSSAGNSIEKKNTESFERMTHTPEPWRKGQQLETGGKSHKGDEGSSTFANEGTRRVLPLPFNFFLRPSVNFLAQPPSFSPTLRAKLPLHHKSRVGSGRSLLLESLLNAPSLLNKIQERSRHLAERASLYTYLYLPRIRRERTKRGGGGFQGCTLVITSCYR